METIVQQMMDAEGVTEELKAHKQMEWVEGVIPSVTAQRKSYVRS